MLNELISNRLFNFDVEFGNAQGYFSGEAAGLVDPALYYDSFERKMVGTIFDRVMNIHETYKRPSNTEEGYETAQRCLCFTPQQEFSLYDFVSRFIIESNDRSGYIAGRSIRHLDRNIYEQHSVSEVIVPVGESGWLKFYDMGRSVPDGFEAVFYLRDVSTTLDGRKRWIVHHRFIARPERAKLVLRGCNPRFEGPLPYEYFLPKVFKRLFYRIREAHLPNFPIMTVGEFPIPADRKVCIDTKIVFSLDWPN